MNISKSFLCLFFAVFQLHSMIIPDTMNLVDSDICPRAQGTWNKEWCWDWARIDTDDIVFPKDFLWGTGTSAYQVEGDCTNNNWSELENQTKEDGTPFLPKKSGKACDHWNRYKEDIQLMKNIGLDAYRFSIEWSKVEPEEGKFDEAALQHYADVCDELQRQGIEPVVGLHHYTDPIWFVQKGGFEKEENIENYVTFAQKVFEKLKDKARIWITFNSPDAYAIKGYMQAMMPPFKKDWQLMGLVFKNVLEAHVRTYQALKTGLRHMHVHKVDPFVQYV